MISKHTITNELSTSLNQGCDWMLIMPSGKLNPRDTRSPWNVGDIADMQAIIQRTLNYAGGTKLMVDYDHQGNALLEGAGGTAVASGWVQKLEARPDGIWALIEWTQKAHAMIKAGEYKYLSPLFTSDANRKVDRILNVGLVNMPALDLEAIAAMAEQNPETETMNFMEKLINALSLKADASQDAIVAAIGNLKKPDDANKAAVDLAVGIALKPIALAAGLAEDANADTMISTIRTFVSNGGDKETVVNALQAEVTATKTELAALQSSVAKDKAESFIDQSTAAHPDMLVFAALLAGFATNCYDGQYFFDTDHPVIDENGNEVSVANTDGGSGTPWFLLSTKRSIKPILFQERKKPEFVARDKVDDSNVFSLKEFQYGVDSRCNVGYGFWQMAWGSKQTLNKANYKIAREAMMGQKGDHGRPLGIITDGDLYLTRDPLEVLLAYENGVENVVSFLTETIQPLQLEMLASLMDERDCYSVEMIA